MKETQGQSWVIAAVQSSSSSYTFSLSLFLPTPPHPSLSHSLSPSISPSSSPYPCGTRIYCAAVRTARRSLYLELYLYRHIPGVPRAFQSFRKSRRFLEETIRYPEICKVHRANVERTGTRISLLEQFTPVR